MLYLVSASIVELAGVDRTSVPSAGLVPTAFRTKTQRAYRADLAPPIRRAMRGLPRWIDFDVIHGETQNPGTETRRTVLGLAAAGELRRERRRSLLAMTDAQTRVEPGMLVTAMCMAQSR